MPDTLSRSGFLKLLAGGAVSAVLPVGTLATAMDSPTEAALIAHLWDGARWMPTQEPVLEKFGGRRISLPTYRIAGPGADNRQIEPLMRYALGRDLLHGAGQVGGPRGIAPALLIPPARKLLGHQPRLSDRLAVVVTYNWERPLPLPGAAPEWRCDRSGFLCVEPALLDGLPAFNGQCS